MAEMRFGPQQDDAYEAWRDALVDDFGRWLPRLRLRADSTDLGLLLDWKRDRGDGRLDRWTRADEEKFLLGWCPRHLSATAEQAQDLPSTVAVALSFLSARGLVAAGSEPIERLTEHAVGLQAEFMDAMDDPSNFGMAKSMFSHLDLGPDDLDGPDALQSAIEEFDALPEEERRRIIGAPDGFVMGAEDPTTATVSAIVARVVGASDPAAWWDLAGAWLDAQPDPGEAIASLIDELGRLGPEWPLLVLAEAPQSRWPALEPVLRGLVDGRAGSEIASVAVQWLLGNGLMDPAEVAGDTLLDATLISLGLLANTAPEKLVAAISAGDRALDAQELIEAAFRREPPHAESLLDAIGAHHPDKTVAKAARRALFRLRGKLVSQRTRAH